MVAEVPLNQNELQYSQRPESRRKTLVAIFIPAVLLIAVAFIASVGFAQAAANSVPADIVANEANVSSPGIFSRAMQGGIIVFTVLLLLVGMSVTTWAALVAKWWHLSNLAKTNEGFIKSFWDSRSLNDLNSRLAEYPYSPVREVFRSGYSELVRGSQLRDQATSPEMAVSAALDNLQRALNKAKMIERRRMEKFQSLLAISASAAPFIGLFGTVWGIMNAFEGIARTGSASLAAVAPGISEALIATAFGLAAAIPAVVGYNIFATKIRSQMTTIDGFGADFLNIVERYLVTDRAGKSSLHSGATSGAGSGAHSGSTGQGHSPSLA